MTQELKTVVVGTRHRGPDAIAALGELVQGEKLSLVREPENPHDKGAVAVFDGKGRHIGFIPRHVNGDVGAALDDGKTVSAVVYVQAIVDKGEVRFAPKIRVSW